MTKESLDTFRKEIKQTLNEIWGRKTYSKVEIPHSDLDDDLVDTGLDEPEELDNPSTSNIKVTSLDRFKDKLIQTTNQGSEPVHIDVLNVTPDIIKYKAIDSKGQPVMEQQPIQDDLVPGGKADNLTPEDIAKKHGVALSVIDHEMDLGIPEEMDDHTNSREIATEIVLDHLFTNPYHYSSKQTE